MAENPTALVNLDRRRRPLNPHLQSTLDKLPGAFTYEAYYAIIGKWRVSKLFKH
jgi:hypothetical protein